MLCAFHSHLGVVMNRREPNSSCQVSITQASPSPRLHCAANSTAACHALTIELSQQKPDCIISCCSCHRTLALHRIVYTSWASTYRCPNTSPVSFPCITKTVICCCQDALQATCTDIATVSALQKICVQIAPPTLWL